jgi:mevalonate kinase
VAIAGPVAASAPGKLILFGEHAVVFGEPALSTAINLRTEVFARPHGEWRADGGSLDDPKYRYVRTAARHAWKGGPLWFEIRSMIPAGAGLGSSAAVTVASLASLASLRGEALDPASIARAAFDVEHEVQGRASPIDTSTATAGGGVLVGPSEGEDLLWTIRRDTRRWSLHRCSLPSLTFVVGNTGISAATGPLVAGVKARVDSSPEAAAQVKEIGQLTLEGLTALREKDLETAGRLMDRDHELLNALGVGHPMLDKLVAAARRHSYGAKLTGAGGGGSMFALTDEPEKTAAAIRAAGGKAFLLKTEPDGVRGMP